MRYRPLFTNPHTQRSPSQIKKNLPGREPGQMGVFPGGVTPETIYLIIVGRYRKLKEGWTRYNRP